MFWEIVILVFFFVISVKPPKQASQADVKTEVLSPRRKVEMVYLLDSDSDDEIIPAKIGRRRKPLTNKFTIKQELQDEDVIVRQITAMKEEKKSKKTEDKQVYKFINSVSFF